MTRKRSAFISDINSGSAHLVTYGSRRTAFKGEAAAPEGKVRGSARGECVVIDLSTARTREPHARPAARQIAASAPSPSTERTAERTPGRARHYVEALVGWLLIFGAAYLALLLFGG